MEIIMFIIVKVIMIMIKVQVDLVIKKNDNK